MAANRSLSNIIEDYYSHWKEDGSFSLAAWDAHLRRIAQAFEQLPVVERAGNDGPDPFEILRHHPHTLPYLYIVSARVQVARAQTQTGLPATLKPEGDLWKRVVAVLAEGEPIQARYAGDSWQTLIETVLQSAVQSDLSPVSSLEAAAAGILRIDPFGSTLTSSHANLIRACLRSRCYAPAKPVLDHHIHSLPSTTGSGQDPPLNTINPSSSFYMNVANRLTRPITLLDILEYYLEGAMIYIALEEWTRATQFLEHVLSTPCSGQGVAHALMLEAYKKWTLTTLLAYGESKSAPRTASGGSTRSLIALSKEYEGVTEAFKLPDGKKLRAEVHEAMAEFQQAGNEGLVRHVLARHQQLVVSKLANTYSVVPFSMVARQLGMSDQETATYVQGLVEQGLVQATVEHHRGQPVLRFGVAGASKIEQELRTELVEQTRRIRALSAQVAEVDQRLGISKEFIEHTVKSRKQKNNNKDTAEQEEAMDISFGGPVSEEDEESVMADVG